MLWPKEVAIYLSVNVTTVYDMLRRGELKGFKVGVKRWLWRIDPDDLEDYLEAGGREAPKGYYKHDPSTHRRKKGNPCG